MDLLGTLTQSLGGNTLGQLSRAVGADERTTQRAAMAALPLLLGAMNRNTNDPQGAASLASALDRDHDGGLLDHLGGFLGGLGGGTAPAGAAAAIPGLSPRAGNGAGILGHIFGDRLGGVERGVGKATGLDSGQTTRLLMALAPMVMAALGRKKRAEGLDAGGLSDLLGRESTRARQAAPDDLLGSLGSLLDRDGDGSPINDVLGGLLGGRR